VPGLEPRLVAPGRPRAIHRHPPGGLARSIAIRQDLPIGVSMPRLIATPRTIHVHGRLTSVRLEPEFWRWLREISIEIGCSTKALIEGIAIAKNPHYPLTSALRLYITAYWRKANSTQYLVDLSRGTRRPRSQQRSSRDTGRQRRPRAA